LRNEKSVSNYQSNEALEQPLSRGQEYKQSLRNTGDLLTVYQGTGHCGPEVPSGLVEVARKSALLSGITVNLICPGWESGCPFTGFKGYVQRGELNWVSMYRDGVWLLKCPSRK